MTKFFDGQRIACIDMQDGATGVSFEHDFFEIGSLECVADLEVYRVADVSYLIDYATSYANGTNPDIDYPDDGNGCAVLPDCVVNFSVDAVA